jgi:endonuclease/exonuclease/phosphatase family metal-dependent hydrolase
MRFLTYNIHRGRGFYGGGSLATIVDDIVASRADVVGLNEVWVRAGGVQLHDEITRRTGLESVFGPAHAKRDHAIGNLVLTRGAIRGALELELPRGIEGRAALIVDIDLDGTLVRFATTHLSLGKRDRQRQIARLAEALDDSVPLVLAGDMNTGAGELDLLRERFTVVDEAPATFPSPWPQRSLDHIVFSRHWRLSSIEALPSRGSDHLPLVAELELVIPVAAPADDDPTGLVR